MSHRHVPQDVSFVLHLSRITDDDTATDLVRSFKMGTATTEEIGLEVDVGLGNCGNGAIVVFSRDISRWIGRLLTITRCRVPVTRRTRVYRVVTTRI